ncbi:MAG: hypothetical protein HZA16_08805 [Nitrospirae bacterium]|nr:hypothetical protein [Nitrospirota bacterium]
MKILKWGLFLLGIIMLSGSAAVAAEKMLMQDSSVEYSADEYMEAEGMAMHSKVYHSQGKMRKVNTTKSKVIVTDPQGRKYEGLMWEAKEGMLVKMDAAAKAEGRNVRMKIELKNIKIAKQDPKLFEIPAGYKNMSMPGMGGGGPSI